MQIILENSCLRLTVDPSRGGKITGLQDVRTGRQWLWKNPHLDDGPFVYGASYVERLDTGGWDEIFPSIAPCRVGEREIPDHGDLVSLPWEVLARTSHSLEMAVVTRFAPCRFTRRLTLEEDVLRMDYTLENTGKEAISYLWCGHPLFALEAGMTLRLPHGTPMKMTGAGGDATETFEWPHAPGFPPLDRIPDLSSSDFNPFAVKLFSDKGSVDRVTLASANALETLNIRWDITEIPFLGLWLNCGNWSGCDSAPYFNLGIEPATSPFDSLEDAIGNDAHCIIHPGMVVRWILELTTSNRTGINP